MTRICRFRDRFRADGFTLVEVVTAIAVFSVLVALLLPTAGIISRRTQRSRNDSEEVFKVRQEAHRYLVTGQVLNEAVKEERADRVRIRLKDDQEGFFLEVPSR